jgi:hypothetical protein
MPANHLYAVVQCPRCDAVGEVEIEVEIDARGFAQDYRVGDRVDWLANRRPLNGSLSTDGYVVCSECNKDYFVEVFVKSDVVHQPVVSTTKKGYMD